MKKLFTLACTLLIGGALAFAQTGAGSTGQTPDKGTTQSDMGKTGKKTHKGSKKGHHKGGKKSKKGSPSTTPPPK